MCGSPGCQTTGGDRGEVENGQVQDVGTRAGRTSCGTGHWGAKKWGSKEDLSCHPAGRSAQPQTKGRTVLSPILPSIIRDLLRD